MLPLALPRTYEANAWSHYRAGKWSESFSECLRWFRDEPFSSGPLGLGSFIAIRAFNDYEVAENLCRRDLIGDPSDRLLRNNLVVALIEKGDLEEANKQYRNIDKGQTDFY